MRICAHTHKHSHKHTHAWSTFLNRALDNNVLLVLSLGGWMGVLIDEGYFYSFLFLYTEC